jgi:hypothetical protein
VKDARAEAQKEVEEYRKAKDDEFKKFEKEVPPLRYTAKSLPLHVGKIW